MKLALHLALLLATLSPIAGYAQSTAVLDDGLVYSAASVVQAATNRSGPMAPGMIGTVYGLNLSRTTRGLGGPDLGRGSLPTLMDGVRVMVANYPAGLYYVSPRQINFLVPGDLRPGEATLYVVRDGRVGPMVRVVLDATAPGLFQLDETTVIATRADGSLLTPGDPARPGEVVILYATGLGKTKPATAPLGIPTQAATIERLASLEVRLNGKAIPASAVLYAGVSPGFAGLYQINLVLPDNTTALPEIRVSAGDTASPAGMVLPVE